MTTKPRRTGRKRLRVLLVDDDPLVRGLLKEVLAGADYQLDEAQDGLEALARAGEAVPDVVVLDLMMPGMNGYEVCRAMRADARFSEVRIVMLTARGDEDARRQGLEAGADVFFSKPFSPLDLIEAVTGDISR